MAPLVRASSPYTKVAGLNPGQGTDNNQPKEVWGGGMS